MKPPAASPSASSWSGALRIRWGLLLALAIVAAYGGALRSPFLFDDEVAVVGNSTIRQLASWSVFQPPANGGTTTGRPLVNFSFALDHALGGGRPEVFHATNLLLHILSALCLWGLLRRWFRAQGMPSPLARVAEPAALGLAAMWALHPLGTETVICIAQRTEALFSLLLLVCLYTFQRGSTATGPRWPWLVASVASCLMGMAAKEVMVMAPLLVLLADRTFVAGSLAAALRKRRVYYLALAATWLAAATLLLVNGGARGQAAGFGLGVTPWQYLLTQCEALVTYLRLVVWPHPLVLDYGNAVVSGVSEVWWQGLLVIGAVSLTIWALWRHPVLGFCGAWFFLLLAPSSSVVPLVTQTMAEHRMYLPLVAPLALLALGCLAYNGGRGAWLLLVVAALLGAVTARRAATFRDAVTIWQDTVDSRPSNARAHRQLAAAWSAAGRVDLAEQHYATAIALQPGDPLGHYNWGVALLGLNRPHEAAREFTSALTLRADYADARVNLGIALLRDGQAQEALTALQLALAEQPSADLHFNVGVVLEALKRTDEARTHYLAALRLDPGIARAHVQLAHLAEQDGRLDEAIGHKREALRLSPDDPTLLEEIGMLYVRMDRFADAAECFAVLTRRDPNNANAWGNLGNAYLSAGRIKEAVVCYERVLRLRPGDRQTEENLQIAKSALR